MASDFLVIEPGLIRHLADLEGIARAHGNLVSALPKRPDDRLEKWDMRRVVEVDPYPGLASRIPGGDFLVLSGPGLHKFTLASHLAFDALRGVGAGFVEDARHIGFRLQQFPISPL